MKGCWRLRGERSGAVVAVTAVLAWVVLACPTAVDAQTPGPVAGVVAGWVSNEHVWKPAAETTAVGGYILGGYLNAPTPVGWFGIRAEGTFTQRGGDLAGPVSGGPSAGGVRADYLSVSVYPRISAGLGRAELFLAAGPTVDQLLRGRVSPSLAPVLSEVSTVFGVGAGIGVGARLTEGFHAEVEVRVHEGLGDAQVGSFLSLRNRSVEFVARVGKALRR